MNKPLCRHTAGLMNVTPYEVGTTDSPDEYVVWGRDEFGADYRARVIVTDCITPRDNKNLMALAIDNDSWTPFPDLYHGDISTNDDDFPTLSPNPEETDRSGTWDDDEPLELTHHRQLEAMLDSDAKLSEILDLLAGICDARHDPELSRDLWWIAQVHIYHAARLIELAEAEL